MVQADPSRRRVVRLQWISLALCVAAITINYVDRATVAVANLDIRHDFHLSATAIGAVSSVWALSFALSQLPTGFMVDRIGGRWLLGLALAVWSLAQAASGLTRNLGQLLWMRAALGVGEAPAYPTSARAVSLWFRREDRGLPSGVYNASSTLGPAIAPPLLTALMIGFGWRMMFIAMGILGLIICLLWIFIYRDPGEAQPSLQEDADIGERLTSPVTFRQWSGLFRFRTMWGLILGAFGTGYVMWMFQAWLPAYLEMQQHISIARTGLIGAIPWIFGIVGSLSGGYISDRLSSRLSDPLSGRKLPVIYGLIGLALFTVLATRATSSVTAVLWICMAIFFMSHAIGAHWTIVATVAPANGVASCASIQNCGGYLGATCSPILTGFIVDKTGSFVAALLVVAGVAILTAIFYQVLIGRPISIVAVPHDEDVRSREPAPQDA